jgi:uncharacterized protein (TIGR03437 family)
MSLGFSIFALTMGAACAQVVTTIAGVDSVFAGSGQPALSVPIGYVNGVTVDNAGNLYFTDPIEHLVLRVSSSGILSVVAGNGIGDYSGDGGPATLAAIGATDTPEQYVPSFVQPVSLGGILLDSQGDILFADGHRVRMVSPSGIITTIAGGGTINTGGSVIATNAFIGVVSGMVFDKAGNLYFCENSHVRKLTPSGTLTVYAGTGFIGYTGDGGPATAAMLNNPLGLAFDTQGNLYVADGNTTTANTYIRRISTTGVITTIAGGGARNPANGVAPLNLNLPPIGGLAFDSTGNLYAYGASNGLLIKLSGTTASPFSTTTLVTSPVNAPFVSNVPATSAYVSGARLYDNSGIAFDSSGNLYIADSIAGYLCKINTQGLFTVVAGNGSYGFSGDGGPAVSAEIQGPSIMTQTPDGTLYFVDSANNRVRSISPAGIINTVLSSAQYPAIGTSESIHAIASDQNSNLYILLLHRLLQLTPNGTLTVLLDSPGLNGDTGDGGLAVNARIEYGAALARDAAGDFYVVDFSACRIREITANGNIHTVAGNGNCAFTPDGATAAGSSLSDPSAVLLDGAGGIYFEEAPNPGVLGNSIIRYITPGGILKTIAGNGKPGYTGDGGPATQASIEMLARTGMLLDKSGNLFFSDSLNGVVRVISPSGIINTYAGNGQSATAGDGGAPLAASFVVTEGLLFDTAGDLLIADIGGNRIRSILATPPPIAVSPLNMNFSATAGGAPTAPKNLNITSPLSGLGFTIELSSSIDWLVVGATAGITPQLITVRVDPTTLTQGTYTATILISSPLANPPNTSVKVTVQVGAALNPMLVVDKAGLSFTYPKSPATQETKVVHVSNSGSGPLLFSVASQTANGGNWLSVSPASGSVTPKKPAPVSVTADSTGLGVGTYTGTVTISSSTTGASQTVNVTMTVSSLNQAIQLSHVGLSFIAVSGAGPVPPSTFAVSNIGRGAMNFTVAASTLSGGPWLSATPSSGTATAGSAPSSVTVTVNQGTLAPGFYFGQVRIDAPGAANTPHLATVALHVLASTADPGPVISPTEVVIKAVAGAAPPGATEIALYNVSASPQTFVSSLVSATPGDNFALLPDHATLNVNQPTPIVIQPLTSTLAPGVYNAQLTFQFSDGNVSRIGLRTIITAVPPATTSSNSDAVPHGTAGCTPSQLVPAVTVLGQSFNVPAAWPVALDTVVTDDCGNAVNAGNVTASFSNGDPPLSLQSSGQSGGWSTTWVSGNTSGPVTVTVTAADPGGTLTGTRELTGALGQLSPAPVVAAAVNSASFVQNTPLAPGSIISLGGANLSNGNASAAAVPLGFTLAGASVYMSSYELPMYFASTGLINAVAPEAISVNTSHQIVVMLGNALSVPIPVDVGPANPAIFTYPVNGDPPTQGAIVKAANYVVAQPSTPVSAGDLLAIFCTGLGATSPSVADGAGAPYTPLANTVATPTVTIGGLPAPVGFSGLTPGSVGLYQINVNVPAGVTPGNQVPVVVSLLGQTAPTLTIAVK